MRANSSVQDWFMMSGVPLPSRSRPSSSHPRPPTPDIKNDISLAALSDIAGRVVTAAWREPQVIAAFSNIKPAVPPMWLDLRKSDAPAIYDVQGKRGPPIYDTDTKPMSPQPSSISRPESVASTTKLSAIKSQRSVRGQPSFAETVRSRKSAATQPDVIPQMSEEEINGLAPVLELPHFKAFAEYVIDNAITGVLQDGATGEQPLHAKIY